LQLFHNSYLGSQGDEELIKESIKKVTEVERKFNIDRPEINGERVTDNKINAILETETDSEKLKQAWEASKKVGEVVEKDVLELVRLRNKLARELGFDNYYTLSLTISEQKEEDIEKIFQEVQDLTNESFIKLKQEIDEFLANRYNVEINELKPWHYQDKFFQHGPVIYNVDLDKFYKEDVLEKAKKYYTSLGLDVEDILQKSDLYERPGKYPHACCIDMDRKGDVRIIQNMKNNEKWMETTLHELGHAVYEKNMDFSFPFILRRAAHTFTTEAIALLFGRLSKNVDFIKNHCDVDEYSSEDLSNISKELFKILKLRQLVFSRWVFVMFNFERELYKNPDQDLNKLWWELVRKYQLINFSRDKPDWASKIHLVSAPVYYHNYLLGEFLASQLNNYIMTNLKPDSSDHSNEKKVSEYLIENIFKPGRKYVWNELIEKATGESLTAKYFVEQFVGE
jgi:peptidyl-dipeptidase A